MIGPPFSSIHQGIQFAVSNAPVGGSSWPSMAPSRATSGDSLSRLDTRAQAAQVMRVVERLAAHEWRWLGLAYGPADSIEQLADDMVPYVIGRIGTGVFNRRLIADLVLWNCGRRGKALSLRRLASREGIKVWKTLKLANEIGKIMQEVGISAFDSLDSSFGEHGWLLERTSALSSGAAG